MEQLAEESIFGDISAWISSLVRMGLGSPAELFSLSLSGSTAVSLDPNTLGTMP